MSDLPGVMEAELDALRHVLGDRLTEVLKGF